MNAAGCNNVTTLEGEDPGVAEWSTVPNRISEVQHLVNLVCTRKFTY